MMRKRLQIGKLLKGDKRLEGESFQEYKDRLKLEKNKKKLDKRKIMLYIKGI